MNLSKTFDTIDFNILTTRIKAYHFSHSSLKYFRSYLGKWQ